MTDDENEFTGEVLDDKELLAGFGDDDAADDADSDAEIPDGFHEVEIEPESDF